MNPRNHDGLLVTENGHQFLPFEEALDQWSEGDSLYQRDGRKWRFWTPHGRCSPRPVEAIL
jgi:hypothetical protein